MDERTVAGESRFVGCLLGTAIGDALGQPVEAFPPERIRNEFGEVRDFMAGDPRLPMPLGAGQWTDDTQMALDIARSILRCGRVDGADIAAEFLRDHEAEGIRFSGFAVTYSLRRLKKGVRWDRAGQADEQAQGNGAAMRIAPVALFDHQRLDQLPEDVRVASISTHRHPEAVRGALATARLIARAAADTLDLNTAIDDMVETTGDCPVAENLGKARNLLAAGTEPEAALEQIRTTGWVVHTVAAATFCFLHTPDNFERTVINAVMGGDDADTTGAIAGAFSGAYNGVEAIPTRWREGVERGKEIEEMARGLYRLVAGSTCSGRESGEWAK